MIALISVVVATMSQKSINLDQPVSIVMPIALAIGIALIIGLFLGGVNGSLLAFGKIPPVHRHPRYDDRSTWCCSPLYPGKTRR